jgi:steroid 5-alpha reductase family enzyme
MKKSDRNALITVLITIFIGVGVAAAGSQYSAAAFGMPLFALLVGLAFLIQWLAFIPAFINQTEKFFDLTGALTYISIAILAVLFSHTVNTRSLLLAGLIIIWAVRLGSFLFKRVQQAGKDDRFDEIKPSFFRYLLTWTMQGLWVTLTLSAALAAITSTIHKGLDLFALIGALIWMIGFFIELIADAQKSRFREDPGNAGRFINSGLWARSRHPNYFGEITLWIGITVMTLPILQGWQWVTLISPVFVTLLITRVSGVPMLEKKAEAKWGGQPDYEEYKKNTPVLIPRL